MLKMLERLMNEEETTVLGGEGADTEVQEETIDESTSSATEISDETTELPAWLEEIDEEYRGEKSLHTFKDMKEVVKSYVHAQKLIGKDNKIALPDKNSSETEINDFYTKMGKPELANYELTADKEKFSEEFLSEFKELAHKNNLMPQQADALLEHIGNNRAAEDAALDTEADTVIQEGLSDLRKEWGDEGFQANAARGNNVIKEFGFDGLSQYIAESGLGNDPMLIRFLANIGKGMSEDTFSEEIKSNMGLTKQEAQDQLDTHMADMDGAYWNSEHAGHESAKLKVNKLYEVLAK